MIDIFYKLFFKTLLSSLILLCAQIAISKPMDAEASKHIPKLKHIVIEVQKNTSLSGQDTAFLIHCMESKDPVLISVSAWIIGESKSPSPELIKALLSLDPDKLSKMPSAFVEIGIKKTIAKLRKKDWDIKKESITSKNIYLTIEIARESLTENANCNKVILQTLQADKSPQAKATAFYIAEKLGLEEALQPHYMFDERYERVLSIILKKIEKEKGSE